MAKKLKKICDNCGKRSKTAERREDQGQDVGTLCLPCWKDVREYVNS